MYDTKIIPMPKQGEYRAVRVVGPLKGPYKYKKTVDKFTKVEKDEFREAVVNAGMKYDYNLEAGGKFEVVEAKATTHTQFNLDTSLKYTYHEATSEELRETVEQTFEIPDGETRTVYKIIFTAPGLEVNSDIFVNDPIDPIPVDLEVKVKVEEESKYKTTLTYNETLEEGQELKSPNGKFRLVMQADGDLVGYADPVNAKGSMFWSSKTSGQGKGPYHLEFQEDGNVVLYDGTRKAIWSTDTYEEGKRGQKLVMQDDRNVALYQYDGVCVWSSDTCIS